MENNIILADVSSEDVRLVFDKLKRNVPGYLLGKGEVNPFIQYIEKKGKIDPDLLDFLYHSDFLSNYTEESLSIIQLMYDNSADIDWFYLMDKIFDEIDDGADEYIKEVFFCFQNGLSADFCDDLLESGGMKSFDFFHKEILQNMKNNHLLLDKSIEKSVSDSVSESEIILESVNLQSGSDYKSLLAQYDKVFVLLQKAYGSIRESKKQELSYKYKIDTLCKKNELQDKLIKMERMKNSELVCRIQELNDIIEGLQENSQNKKEDFEQSHELIKEENLDVSFASGENISGSDGEFDAAWENALNDISETEEEAEDYSIVEEDYSNVSFSNDESEQEFDNIDSSVNVDPFYDTAPEPYQYTDEKKISSDKSILKKKSRWFLNSIFGYSRKSFLNQPRKDQEGLIFIKMMEMHFSMDKSKIVRDALTDIGEAVPCFDLYKLICKNPSNDELMSFFGGFIEKAVNE